MGPIDLSFDVTSMLSPEVTEGMRITIAAWLFLPDDVALLGERPVTMALLPGGSYDKRYYHLEIAGYPGYSAARHLAGKGNIVLALDHLGVGGSTRLPRQACATRHVVAQANDAALALFYHRLGEGTLHPALPAYDDFVRIGGGHSMGAMQTIVQQAVHRSYDALMILGYTAQGVHIVLRERTVRAADLLPDTPSADYATNDRTTLRHNFHWDDVPDAVIAADDAHAVATPSCIGHDSIRSAIIVEDAATIDVPIYLCLGERDVSPHPHAEAGFFTACRDFTLHILPRAAHCQNFAGTRHMMWDRMHDWSRSIMI